MNDDIRQDVLGLKLELELAVDQVLLSSRSILWGRAYDVIDDKTRALAVKDLVTNLVFPVFKEMGLVDSCTVSEHQGRLEFD